MALIRLTTEEMIQVSKPWLQAGEEAHQAIMAIPELASLMPRFHTLYKDLCDTQPKNISEQVNKLTEDATEADAIHDQKVRGLFHVLLGASQLSDDPVQASELSALKDTVLPTGLEQINESYRSESGAVTLLETRMSDDAGIADRLKKTIIDGKGFEQHVLEWIAVGKKLGALEDQRERLRNDKGKKGGGREHQGFRRAWVRFVNRLRDNAGYAEISDATDALLFDLLRAVEKRANQRGGGGGGAAGGAGGPGAGGSGSGGSGAEGSEGA